MPDDDLLVKETRMKEVSKLNLFDIRKNLIVRLSMNTICMASSILSKAAVLVSGAKCLDMNRNMLSRDFFL